MASNGAGNGRHTGGHAAARRRNRTIAGVAVAGILAFAGGFLLASRGGTDTAAPSPTVSRARSPRPSRSARPSPSASAEPSPTAAPTSPPSPATLPDGRSFGLIVGATGTQPGPVSLRVDVARFLTGDAADRAAAAHGEPTPVPNGYYIVNDDRAAQTVPVAPSARVRYIPENMCCEAQPGTLDGFLATVEGTAMTDYPSIATTYWWLTVEDGRIVAIEQQYLP